AAKQAIFHADVTRIDPDIALERTAVESFLKALTVAREDVANVITVTFASRDPTKAANIANAVADNYIATTLEAKVNSTKIATEWLQDRLMQLKTQTLDAERELQNYKVANNLLNPEREKGNSEQLAALKTQLANARMAMVEAKARYDRLKQTIKEG